MYAEGGTISTFSAETRGRFINHDCLDPPDKDDTLEHNTGYSILRLIVSLHPERVQKHLFADNDTCTILAAAHKTGFTIDLRCTFRIC